MGFSSPNAMTSSPQAAPGGEGYTLNMPSFPGASTNTGLSDMQAVGLGMQGIGAVTGAAGAYSSASAKKGMLNMDASIAGFQASQALSSGAMQGESAGLQTGALLGRQRANLAANGVQLGSGSALDVLSSTKYIGDVDQTTIHNNALRAAWGYDTQATIDKSAASSINPGLSGLTTLLGGAGSVASSWYKYNTANSGGIGG